MPGERPGGERHSILHGFNASASRRCLLLPREGGGRRNARELHGGCAERQGRCALHGRVSLKKFFASAMNGPSESTVYRDMNECSRTRLLLPIRVGPESARADLRRAKEHLAVCNPCREEEFQLTGLISTLRAVSSTDDQLPEAVRRQIAIEAARGVEHRPCFWGLPAPVFVLPARSRILAAAALLLFALPARPVVLRTGRGPVRSGGVESIQVVAAGPAVRAAWHNGAKGTYTVYKSTD